MVLVGCLVVPVIALVVQAGLCDVPVSCFLPAIVSGVVGVVRCSNGVFVVLVVGVVGLVPAVPVQLGCVFGVCLLALVIVRVVAPPVVVRSCVSVALLSVGLVQ